MQRRVAETVYGFKVLVEEETDRVFGAHLVGPHVDEVINLFALAIRQGLTAENHGAARLQRRRGRTAAGQDHVRVKFDELRRILAQARLIARCTDPRPLAGVRGRLRKLG